MFKESEFKNLIDPTVKEWRVSAGIPRLTSDTSYSTGNFEKLRNEYSRLQLDSVNGTTDRMKTILDRTGWNPGFFQGKLILECGCGAGPDTEILLKLGARVVSVDIAGVDIAANNIGDNENVQFVQASIMDLPLQKESFDIVFCHRVLQHTPDPEKTLNHILQFVKPDGAVFVHSYAKTFIQMARWKYVFRPVTKRMNPEKLYRLIQNYAQPAFKVTNFFNQFKIGRAINHVFIPFLNYRNLEKFKNLSDVEIIEYGIHDTFDALSPPYDHPISANTMRSIAEKYLKIPFEIEERDMVTLLRTLDRPSSRV